MILGVPQRGKRPGAVAEEANAWLPGIVLQQGAASVAARPPSVAVLQRRARSPVPPRVHVLLLEVVLRRWLCSDMLSFDVLESCVAAAFPTEGSQIR